MTEILDRLKAALADRYTIERELGAGGMATVYLAQDVKHDRKVAIKVLRPELAAVLGAERFVQEIKTTASLQHPHILPLHDSGEADGFLYYVMPFIDGETLRDKLNRETQLGIEEAVKITTEVADALDYAHRNNVIHRDIKPENILLHDGRPMVADFGIALAVSAAAGGRMTETGLSLGTPHYMSPEQATAEKDLTNRSDIYSLGAMLYEMLTGSPPHVGSSAQQIIMKIVTDEARPVTELRKSVPPNVAAAVAKALERLPADRFGSAAKMAEALTDTGFRTSATAGIPPRGAPIIEKRWKRLSIGLAVLLTAMVLWTSVRPEQPTRVARYRETIPVAPTAVNSLASRLALSPDGQRLVFVGSGGGGELWVRGSDQLDASRLPGTEGARNPFFSPDGSRVGFLLNSPRSLNVVPVTGGSPVAIAGSVVGVSGAAWGHDTYLYTANSDSLQAATDTDLGVIRIPEGGGSWENVTTLDRSKTEIDHKWPHPLPNGSGLVFIVVYGDRRPNDLAVVHLPSGVHRVLRAGVAARYAASGHLLYVTEEGTLFAVPFDQNALEITGDAMQLAERIRVGTARHRAVDLAVSTEGRLTYIAGGAESDVLTPVWVNRDGNFAPVEDDWTIRSNAGGGLDLSPDGTVLAIDAYNADDGHRNVFIKPLHGGLPARRLTFDGNGASPVWNRNGRFITFISGRTGHSAIWQRQADGRQAAELLFEWEPGIVGAAILSLDAEWLIFGTQVGDILAIRPGIDSIPRQLVASEFDETSAALSPDGQWLAYGSDRSGRPEIYVRPFPNTEGGPWQVSENGGTEPVWSHDGLTVFYRDDAHRMVAAEIVLSPDVGVVRRDVLFDASPYLRSRHTRLWAVSRDGEQFLMLRPVGGQVEELITVENFFEELKTKGGN